MQVIQKRIQEATEPVPAQGAAQRPDDEIPDETEYLEGEISSVVYFAPMSEKVIAAFGSGAMNKNAFMKEIRASQDVVSLEMTEGLSLVLTNYGKNIDFEEVTDGGEVVADSSGEAFIPEHIEVTAEDGMSFIVCDPTVFKFPDEVKTILAQIENIDKSAFYKKANIKKLLKSGWLEGYDKRSVKEEADYIISELWNEFVDLQKVYRKAAEQNKGLLLIVGYLGE